MIQHGIQVVWGFGEAPELPPGFNIRRDGSYYAVAVSGDGKEFIIALNPARLVPIIKRDGHTTFADFKAAIQL